MDLVKTRQDKTIYYNLGTRMVLQEDNNYTLTITYILIHLHRRSGRYQRQRRIKKETDKDTDMTSDTRINECV